MNRNWILTGLGLFIFTLATTGSGGAAWAAPQDQQQKPSYTLAEYNAYNEAHGEQNPQQKIAKLEGFIKQYPSSTLLPYVYRDLYLTDYAQKNYAAAIDYADRQLALGNIVAKDGRLEAAVARAQAFYVGSANDKTLQSPDAQAKARDAAVLGLKMLDDSTKPDSMTADQFEQQKKGYRVLFNSVAATASIALKDYSGAAGYYKAVLSTDPNDAASHFRLGAVYLQMSPPQPNDGFWELARSIAIKSPNGPNEQQVRDYIKSSLLRYQQPACDKLADDQVNELLTLASSSADRPATFSIPSAADLQKAREDTANFLPALKAGGDAGKIMWLASCGLEYQDVGVWAMSDATVNGDTTTIEAYRPGTQDPDAAQKEIDTATAPNMEVKIVGQPAANAAAKIKKGDQFRFTGTLTGYSQSPFLLTWDKAKVNPEDLPGAQAAPAKRAPAKKAPSKSQ